MDVDTSRETLEQLAGAEPSLAAAIAQILNEGFSVETEKMKGILERHLMFTVLLSAVVGLATGSLATLALNQRPREPRIFIVAEGLQVENADEFIVEIALPRSFPMARINRNQRIRCEHVKTDIEQIAAAAFSRNFDGDQDDDGDYCE